MTARATRHLYLVRHAEALPDESGLTENGRRQAVLLGRRLRGVPLAALHHGPLPRAAQTARLIADQLDGVLPQVAETAGDYLPYVPQRAELPPDCADHLLRFSTGSRPGSGNTARPWQGMRSSGSPARSPVTGTATNWSSPTTSWRAGSSGTPSTHRTGAGSASTTPTPP